MNNTLLPPHATSLMSRIEQASERATTMPVPLRKLWDPDACPTALLPYLAWALSVDRWDPAWSDATKRAAIKQSYFIHRHKGTTAALRRAVEPLGYVIRVLEWWQSNEAPGTFRLDVGVEETGITEEMYHELERLIEDAKPVSRHLIGLSLNLDVSGPFYVGAATCHGDTLAVYPYLPETLTINGKGYTGGAVHLIDSMRVNV
ncbi:phage tail protein I [Serratia ureilytica]|uniref:phage tail protein I n=1 Tax=Serratia ureilytica TaxID=300181 RepID=UPI003714ADA2